MADEVTAILLAAGASRRMGGDDKPWVDLGGRPLVAWPLEMLSALDGVDEVVVVAPRERHGELCALAPEGATVRCVEGGTRRRDSVEAALAAAPGADWYVVHDAARPLASAAMARRVLDAAREAGAAVPGLAVTDTIKRVDEAGLVVETPPRERLRAVQTPQAFAGELLRRAHGEAPADLDASDDAVLVERLGEPVRVVEGEERALKVTQPADLERVRAWLREEER